MEYPNVFGVQWIEQLSSNYPGNTRSQYLLVDMAMREQRSRATNNPRHCISMMKLPRNTRKVRTDFLLKRVKNKFNVAPFHLLQRLNPGPELEG